MAATYDDLYLALEDERPLDLDKPADVALYVAGLHSVDGINPADELLLQMKRARKAGTWFFTGHRGVGKSTELRRVAQELRQAGHFVVVADMNDYLNLAEPISLELLLLTMAAALSHAYERQFGGQPLARGLVTRLADYLKGTEVKVEELSATFGADPAQAGVKLSLKEQPVLRERVLKAVQGALGSFVAEVRGFVTEVVGHVARAKPQAKVVLILDSLERLRVSGLGADERYDAVQKTFEVYAEHLRFDDMLVVYSIPPYLPYLAPRLGAYIGATICTLPHVKVFKSPQEGADQVYPPGIDHMVDCARRRHPEIEQVIERSLLERLAKASSGSVRDYFRLLRTLSTKAPLGGAPTPLVGDTGARWASAAEQDLQAEMPLADEDLVWLARVRATHGNGLAELGQLPKLARLFDSGVILGYKNGEPWCDVHYLLRDRVDKAARAAA